MFFFNFDILSRLDIYHLWVRVVVGSINFPFISVSTFLVISFWSRQMSTKGVFERSNRTRYIAYVCIFTLTFAAMVHHVDFGG